MRLEIRVTLWLAALLGAAAALTLAGMATFQANDLERQALETARLLALTTENSLEVSMINNARDDLRRSVTNVQQGTLLDSVSIYGRDGSAWVTSDAGSRLGPEQRRVLLQAMETNRPTTSSESGRLSVFVPVLNQPTCAGCHPAQPAVLGAVGATMNERPVQAELARNARYSLYLAVLPLVLGLIASIWWVRRSVLKPVAQLGDAAERLGEGDLSVRLPPFKGREFASVASTFNDMVSRLQRSAADLTSTVDQLRADLEGMEEIQALLVSGAGLKDVLTRAARLLGSALEAIGVRIRRADGSLEAVWGTPLVLHTHVVPDGAIGIWTSSGRLADVPEETGIAWAVAPVWRRGRTLAVVGMTWDPPRTLGEGHRGLLATLAGLVGVAVENADLLDRLREKEQSLQGLVRKTLVAQEEERVRIARELHDETSQVLTALMMNIELLETQIPTPGPVQTRVEAVKSLAEEAARNLDTMLLDLRPALLDELGLIAALRWYVAQMRDVWGVRIEFEAGRTARFPEHVEMTAFRIVQEAVTNAARHARASCIRVKVFMQGDVLCAEIRDDGVGFDVQEISARARSGEGAGLLGMRERAELVGGSLLIESRPGSGTTVTAELPLEEG